MNEEQVKIATKVAENSIAYFDGVLQQFQLMAYEEMRKIITTDFPEHDKIILDPVIIIEKTLDRMRATRLANLIKDRKAGYVRVDDLLKDKSDKTC